MKIADYGKAITSYIESPTTAQKLKSKESANLLAEIDFSGMTVPQLRILYERYTGSGAPRDPRELIIELKRLMKNLDQDGVPFATGGRVHLAEGSEDIVEPPKSMQVDTTTKGPDLFTLDKFKDKAEIYILALNNRAMPLENIKSALNKFTKQGLNDGTFTVDEAIKVVKNLKFEVQDRAQKQRLRDNIIAGTGTLSREDFAIGGGAIEGEDLGTREGFATIKKLEERFSSKPGKYFVRSNIAVRDIPLEELKKLPGFVRTTSEGIVFDKKVNAQNFIKGDLLTNTVKAANKKGGAKLGEQKKIKNKNPKLFNRIIKLAEEGKTSVQKIGEDPKVVKLNNGKKIQYGTIQRIITDEKGKEFFDKVAETKQPFIGSIRKSALANLDNILEDYYKGMGTKQLTKKYFPDSPDAKRGAASTVLENVIEEKADPKKLKVRPSFIVTGEGISPAQIILNNPKAKAEFIKFGNAPENRILDSMEEAGKIAKKYAPEGLKISGYKSRTGFMDSGLRDLITKKVEFSNPFIGRGEGDRVATEVEKTRLKRLSRTAPIDVEGTKKFQFHHIMNIGGEIPLDLNDVAIINERMNRTLSPYNTRLNNIADSITDLITNQPEGYLKRIDELNDSGEKVVKQAIKELPNEYKKLIGFNRIVPVFDEYGTPLRFVGQKFGGSGKKNAALKLEKLTTEQVSNLKKQVKADAKALEKGRRKDKILSSTGKVLKGIGKVIKPIGYAVGTKALFDATAMAKEQGIELSLLDKAMALDSGDPEVALNNAKRRVDPEFAAAEKAKDLAKMTDDFEEVGQSPFGKYNDQIKNIKLP
jgi:hypothetical protein